MKLPAIITAAAFGIFQTFAPAPSFTPAWQSLKISSGGLLNNISISSSDATTLISANTYGAYLYKTSGTCAGYANGGWGSDYASPCMEQLFTKSSVSGFTLTDITHLEQGVLAIDGCNNSTNNAYAWFNKVLYVSANVKAAASSRTWTATPLTTTVTGNQGVGTGNSRMLACDPLNPNVVYAGNLTALYQSVNGLSGASASFATFGSLPAPSTFPDLIDFDPASASTTCGGQTCSAHFYVFVQGTGVEETTNGGASFTLTTGGPTSGGGGKAQMKVDKFGQVWMAINSRTIYKYTPNGTAGGGTWTSSLSGTNNNATNIAIDPSSASLGANRVVVAGADGLVSISTNNGSSWSAFGNMSYAASGAQPAWMGNAQQYSAGLIFLTMNDMNFDASGNLWGVAGIGAWQIASASINSTATWQANSVGIEQLVANHVDAPAGVPPVVGVWDRGFFSLQNPDLFPAHYWPDRSYSTSYGAINDGWAFDWASSQPTTLSGWSTRNNTLPATTANGGNTWTAWASTTLGTTNIGGDIAVSTPSNWVVVPAGSSSNLEVTTNGGTSFAAATITGVSGPISASNQHGFHIAADRVNANTFCLIDNGGSLWASTNSGATFTKNNASTLTGQSVKYNDALKAMPGQAATFYYSGGNAGGSSTTYNLWKVTKTTNECDTATKVNASITNIFGMGFGAPVPGSSIPTIYFWGAYLGVTGLYQITNGGTTPTLISAPASAQSWANNSADFINDVSGDMNFYGRVYVAHNGSGFTYIDTADACPWVEFSNQLPGAALTGTVTLTAQTSGLAAATISDVKFFVDGVLIGTQTTYTGGTSGTPRTYSQSWVTGGVATGAHTITVASDGNGCTANTAPDAFTIPITTF